MKPIETFTVVPALPARLHKLSDLAYNLRWSWDHETRALFRRMDRGLWEETGRNPVLMLGRLDQHRLDALAEDLGFAACYDRVCESLERYMTELSTWCHETRAGRNGLQIAYFSAEFALTDCLPIYSGGLGVLAGDHLKSASDLGLPLVGVGLLYQRGYIRQYLNADGWQQEAVGEYDFHTMPVRPVTVSGESLKVGIPMERRTAYAQVWYAQVGRVPLYLLDTNVPENTDADRNITAQLYGGDKEMRIRQEMVLGIGGKAALEALDIHTQLCHLNEGHSAFAALERIRRLMKQHGLSFAEAREAASAGHVFTTHTPVAAGNDYFPASLIERYFRDYWQELGLSREAFLGLGRLHPEDPGEEFCMTVLALRLSNHNNGVSRLHESVARAMWAGIWPEAPQAELPLSHVTNGVHAESWLSDDLLNLLDSYIGPGWRGQSGSQDLWRDVAKIPGEELWRTHERRRERLVAFARRRLQVQLRSKNASILEVNAAHTVLDPQALTIGFARRFAGYKRALLLFRDPERLARLLNDPQRPVQLIFAGKAHPRDEPAKEIIRNLVHTIRQPQFRESIVFLEDYDLNVARFMVQGADVWLNTPRRPLEASGTSGMKAALNGVLNVSIMDGWWDEAYDPEIGWAIGKGEVYDDEALQDQVESEALFDLLEKEVVPLFYERKQDHIPVYWVQRVKRAMASLCPAFNTHRMLGDYAQRFYFPAQEQAERLYAEDFTEAKRLAAWKSRVAGAWGEVRIEGVSMDQHRRVRVGQPLTVHAYVRLGALKAEDVAVQLCFGKVNAGSELVEPTIINMPLTNACEGVWRYEATVEPSQHSGLHGLTVRVLPFHKQVDNPWCLGLVAWANGKNPGRKDGAPGKTSSGQGA